MGVASAVGLAFLGVPAGQLLVSEFQSASAQNAALNARRTTAEDEGVAPEHGQPAAIRYAATTPPDWRSPI